MFNSENIFLLIQDMEFNCYLSSSSLNMFLWIKRFIKGASQVGIAHLDSGCNLALLENSSNSLFFFSCNHVRWQTCKKSTQEV